MFRRSALFALLFAAAVGAEVLPIHQVQGPEPRSRYEGQRVTVRGVVTGVTAAGFFLQETVPDQDPATSEGLYVYTGSGPGVAPGDLLEVEGTVVEYTPAADPVAPPLTELVSASWQRLARDYPLPSPVPLSLAFPDPGGGWEQLEAVEGMRVAVDQLVVTGPSLGRVDEPSASASSTGVFFGVVAGHPRPFREPGFPLWDDPPQGQPPRWDGNPELLRVNSTCLAGALPRDVAAGAVLRDLVGPLTFAFRRFTLCPEPDFSQAATPPLPAPPPEPAFGTLVVASWNLQRFYDHRDDPTSDEPVLTPEAWTRRKGKLVAAVREYLRFPQVLVLEEVESLEVLQELAQAIGQEASASLGQEVRYAALVSPGPNPAEPKVGMLVANVLRGVHLEVLEAAPILQEERLANPDGSQPPLFDRPPLFAHLAVRAWRRAPVELALVGVHLRSMNGLLSTAAGSNGWRSEGARVRAKRAAQGEALARWVDRFQQEHPQLPLLLLGDFNAFEVSDGVVDVLGTVAGAPAPAEEVVLPTQDLVQQDLRVLTRWEPLGQRYSYVYDGSAQALDHALVSQSLEERGVRVQVARPRLAADWPETLRQDPGPLRLSDHDPLLLLLDLPRTPLPRLLRERLPAIMERCDPRS